MMKYCLLRKSVGIAISIGGFLFGVDSALARITLTSLNSDNSQSIIDFDPLDQDRVVEIKAPQGESQVTLSGSGGNTCYVRVRGGSIVVSSPIVVDLEAGSNGTNGAADCGGELRDFIPGTAGSPGESAPNLTLETIPEYVAGEILDITVTSSITLNGADGGNGGNGSEAERCDPTPVEATPGRDGAAGGNGGNIEIISSGNLIVSSSLSSVGGDGGKGGDGGLGLVVACWAEPPLPPADGADGGNGGASGSGGTITLSNANARICNSISISGSISAQSGNTGNGGNGGDLFADPGEETYEVIGDCDCDGAVLIYDYLWPGPPSDYPCGIGGDAGSSGLPLLSGQITITGFNINLHNASLSTDAGSVGNGGDGGDGAQGGDARPSNPNRASGNGGDIDIISYYGSDISIVNSTMSAEGGDGGNGGQAGSAGVDNTMGNDGTLDAGARGYGVSGGSGGYISMSYYSSDPFNLIANNSSIRSNGGNGGDGGDAAMFGYPPFSDGGGAGNGGNGYVIDIGAQAVYTCSAIIESEGGDGGTGDPDGSDGSGGTIVAPTYTADCTAQPVVLFIMGDMDCDGDVDMWDNSPYQLARDNPGLYLETYPHCCITAGDCNNDGAVTADDDACFIALLLGS